MTELSLDHYLKEIDERGGVWPADARLVSLYDGLTSLLSKPRKGSYPSGIAGCASKKGAETMLFAKVFPFPENAPSLVMCILDPSRAPKGFFSQAPEGVPFQDVSLKFVSFCMNMLARSEISSSGKEIFNGGFSKILYSNAFDGRLRGVTPAELAVGVAYDERRGGAPTGSRLVDEMLLRKKDSFGEKLVEWLFFGGEFPAPFDANAFLRVSGHRIKTLGFPGVSPEGLRALAPSTVRPRYVFRPEQTDEPLGVPLALHAGMVPDGDVWIVEKNGEKRMREGFSLLDRESSRAVLSSESFWVPWNKGESTNERKLYDRVASLSGRGKNVSPQSREWPSKSEVFIFPPNGTVSDTVYASNYFGEAGFIPVFEESLEWMNTNPEALESFILGVHSSPAAQTVSRNAFAYAVAEIAFFGKSSDDFHVHFLSASPLSSFFETSVERAATLASLLLDLTVMTRGENGNVVFFEPSWKNFSIEDMVEKVSGMCEYAQFLPVEFSSLFNEEGKAAWSASDGVSTRNVDSEELLGKIIHLLSGDTGFPSL